jgi:peptidyl-prolyl cis-trans isomerase SurA
MNFSSLMFPLRSVIPVTILSLAIAGISQPLKTVPGSGTAPAGGAQTKPATPAATPGTAQTGQTAVMVGTVAIKKNQIDTLAALMARARGADLRSLPAEQSLMLKRMVTTNLIGQELLELEAKARGVQASAREIDSAVKVLKGQFPDAASWQRAMRQSGDTEAGVREKVARQIRSDKLLAANIPPPSQPTEAEMRTFWEQNKREFPVSDSLRAVQILLLGDARITPEAANEKRRKLESIRRELAGDSADTPMLLRRFMNEAARNGEGPEARIGGDLERFHPDDFHPDFKSQVVNLRVGQMSPVFRTPLGFHLVLLIEKFDGKFDSYRLQSLQNLTTQKNMKLGTDMRDFLKKLAVKHPVKYLLVPYRDTSESGIY